MIEMLPTVFGLIQGVLVMLDKRSNWAFYTLQMFFLVLFSIKVQLWGDVAIDSLEAQTISLYDPPQLSIINFQLSTFETAWKESQHYMVRVLQSVEEYEPQPVNLENIPLGDELNELIEAIAENAHDVWAVARMKEGCQNVRLQGREQVRPCGVVCHGD